MFNVTFGENGNLPALTELSTYVVSIFSGSNRHPILLKTFPPATGTFDSNVGLQTATFHPINVNGPSTPNAYFLGINSTLRSNTSISIMNYSARFTISEQDGQATREINDGNSETVGTTGPQRSFTCNSIPCIPFPAQVSLPPSSTSRSPNVTISACSSIPPIPQTIPPRLASGIGAYIGVVVFIGVFSLVIIIGVIAALRLERRRRQLQRGTLIKSRWNRTPSLTRSAPTLNLESHRWKL